MQADCLKHCPLQLTAHDVRPGSPECENAPLGVNARDSWPNMLLYTILITESNFSHPRQSKIKLIISLSDSPSLAMETVASKDCPASSGRPGRSHCAATCCHKQRDRYLIPRTYQSLGLAREGLNLNALGLPQEVINTI